MLRRTLLWLSNRRSVFRLIRRNRLAQRFARRFVAGETTDDALQAVRTLNARGISVTLDLLGESVTQAASAAATADQYVQLLDRIHAEGLDANVSLKLTAMGLDIDDAVCLMNVTRVVRHASQLGNFVRLDMEGSAYTERTLELFKRQLYPAFPNHVGIVLQSYLRRTRSDVERAIGLQCRVRLCKGAYREPADIAFPAKRDVDASFVECMRMLLADGRYPALATHDERMIAEARRFVTDKGIASDGFEFQMLYGVRRDLQGALVRDGFRMRVYVPFGTQWYPYLMRRLAERPANIAFMTANIVKELVRSSR